MQGGVSGSIPRQARFRRVAIELGYAAGKLERFSAPVCGVVPDLSFALDDAHQIHSPAPGLPTKARRSR
jgi:hypothetical protein